MGLIYSDMELISSDDLALERRGCIQEDRVRKMKVSMLVDSGAMMLSVNETIKVRLGLSVLDRQMGELADGSRQSFKIVGHVDKGPLRRLSPRALRSEAAVP